MEDDEFSVSTLIERANANVGTSALLAALTGTCTSTRQKHRNTNTFHEQIRGGGVPDEDRTISGEHHGAPGVWWAAVLQAEQNAADRSSMSEVRHRGR